MTKAEVREILKPLVIEAYNDGKQGNEYAYDPTIAAKADFIAFYRKLHGEEPEPQLLSFFDVAQRVLHDAYERGQRAAQEDRSCGN